MWICTAVTALVPYRLTAPNSSVGSCRVSTSNRIGWGVALSGRIPGTRQDLDATQAKSGTTPILAVKSSPNHMAGRAPALAFLCRNTHIIVGGRGISTIVSKRISTRCLGDPEIALLGYALPSTVLARSEQPCYPGCHLVLTVRFQAISLWLL